MKYILIALALVLAGIAWTVSQHSASHCENTPCTSLPIIPVEPNAPVKSLEMPEHWKVSGKDEAGRLWEGYLVVERAPAKYMCLGYFDWQSSSPSEVAHGGQYHFEGTFDPQTRRVSWTGYSIENRTGHPAMAQYDATLSADGSRLENGKWSGGFSIPGTWEAVFLYRDK
jgi:hypothetical protein